MIGSASRSVPGRLLHSANLHDEISLFCRKILVDASCTCSSGFHRENNRSRASHCVASGINALFRCLSIALIRHDTSPAVDLRPLVVLEISGFGEVPSAMITVSVSIVKSRTDHLNRTSSSRFIRLAKLHTAAYDAFDPSVLILENLNRVGQKVKMDALLFFA